MPEDIPVIALAESEQAAFEVFSKLAEGLQDVRGEYIEIDLGNYVHVLGEEERIKQIPWIPATLEHPERIIRLAHARKGKRPIVTENYVKRIRSTEEEEGNFFIVGVERVLGRLRLRTWFKPRDQAEYIDRLSRKGETIWQVQQ